MALIYITGKKQIPYPYVHDPQDEKYYTFLYRPNIWEANKEYLLDDVVVPATSVGCMFVCINPGLSGATEPVFSQKLNSKTFENTLTWKTLPYNLALNTGDSISLSTWTSIPGVLITNPAITAGTTECKVAIDTGIIDTSVTKEFILTNNISILRLSGKTEIYDRSIVVPLGDL